MITPPVIILEMLMDLDESYFQRSVNTIWIKKLHFGNGVNTLSTYFVNDAVR